MGSAFTWEGNLEARLNQMGPQVKRAMVAGAQYVAGETEDFMRSNASWTDQTGAARAGLGTQVVVSTNKVALVMYHSVPYGVFLEVRWGGKYGIIEKSMAAAGPRLVEVIGRLAFA